MELQWVIIVDEYGRKSEPSLQYRENENDEWQDVPIVEIKSKERE